MEMSSNCLFSLINTPKPEDTQCSIIKDKQRWKIEKLKLLLPMESMAFLLQNENKLNVSCEKGLYKCKLFCPVHTSTVLTRSLIR